MKDDELPTTIPCPYCDGHGFNRAANAECGFCTRGRLTITEPFIPRRK